MSYFVVLLLVIHGAVGSIQWNVSYPPINLARPPQLHYSKQSNILVSEVTLGQTDVGTISGVNPATGATVWALNSRSFYFTDMVDSKTGLLATYNETHLTVILPALGSISWIWPYPRNFRPWNTNFVGDYLISTQSLPNADPCYGVFIQVVTTGKMMLTSKLCPKTDTWYFVGSSSQYSLLQYIQARPTLNYLDIRTSNTTQASVLAGFQNAMTTSNSIITCSRSDLQMNSIDGKQLWDFTIPSTLGSCTFFMPLYPLQQLILNDDQSMLFLAIENPTSLIAVNTATGKLAWSVVGPQSLGQYEHFYYPCYTNGIVYIYHGYQQRYQGILWLTFVYTAYAYDATSGALLGKYDFAENWLFDSVPVCGNGQAFMITRNGIESTLSYLSAYSP